MFHILSCYYITIHCSNFKIWQWCILAGQSISVFSWVDRKHLANEDAPRRCNDVKIIVPGWNCIDNACHHKHAGPKTCFYTSKLKTTYCIVQSVGRYEQIVKRRAVRRIVHFFSIVQSSYRATGGRAFFFMVFTLYTRTGVCSHDLLYWHIVAKRRLIFCQRLAKAICSL